MRIVCIYLYHLTATDEEIKILQVGYIASAQLNKAYAIQFGYIIMLTVKY